MSDTRSPAVSVVIPVRDGAGGLERAVESALSQAYDGPLEVVIAVAPGDDRTAEIAHRLAADRRVRVVANPKGGTAAGLNAAIAASTGEVVVRCDAHAALPPEYVATALRVLARSGAATVGGMQVAVGTTVFGRAVAAAVRSRLGAGDARYRVGGTAGPVDTVYLGVFRRSVLERLGGYDERFVRSQDAELNHRIRAAGGTVWFEPGLRVEYRPRRSVGSLWHQYFQYGWWKRMMSRVHRGTLRPRQVIPVLFVLGLLGSAVVAPVAPAAAVALPAAYAAVLVAATLWRLIRTGDPAALLLLVVYPTIHLAWGAGFLAAQFRPVPE